MADLDALLANLPEGDVDLGSFTDEIAKALVETVGCESCEIWLWRKDESSAPRLARVGRAGPPVPEVDSHEAVEEVGDRTLDGSDAALMTDPVTGRSVVQVPIGLHGHALLALGASSVSQPMLSWLTHASEEIAGAIARRLPHEELVEMNRWLLRRNAVDRVIARRFAKVRTLAELGLTIDAVTDRLFAVEYSGIYFLDPETGALRLVHAKGLTEEERVAAEATAIDRHPGAVLRTGRAIDVPDTAASPDDPAPVPTAHGKQILSRMYLPVRVDGVVVGTVGFASARRGSFSSRHRKALSFLADFAGLTYARIVAAHENARRGALLQASHAAAERLLGGIDWRAAANASLALVGSALDAGTLAVLEVAPPQSSNDGAVLAEFIWQPTFGGTWSRAARLSHPTDDERARLAAGESVSIRFDATSASAMVKPIIVDGALWGVLSFEPQGGSHRSLDLHDRSAIRALANAFALAIGRERLDQMLRQRQRMEAIGFLASGLAKDFNNLLWPILLYTEMLERSPGLDARTLQMLSEIRSSARQVSGLVQQVLALSQSRERFDEPIPVAPIVVAVGELLRRSAPSILDIAIEVTPDVGDILGDADSLHHALTRLAVRAVDALRGRSGKVTLRADMSQRGGRPQVRIAVSDTGPALGPETCAHLFDPYTPLGQGAESPDRSNRLGLAAVQRIVTEFGGTISVESVPGKGTRFELLFPSVHVASRTSAPARPLDARPVDARPVDAGPPGARAEHDVPMTSVGGHGEDRGGRDTILLVDDDPAVLQVEREMLESVGYRVIACADPDEALRILADRNRAIALMLTDLTMPGLDGIELAVRAKRIRPALRIVCCTGYGDGRSERRGLEAGISAFVHKPIDLDRLAATLRQTIET